MVFSIVDGVSWNNISFFEKGEGMNLLLKLVVFIVPTTFIFLFFIILTNEDSYPGADYNQFQIPQFELKDLNDSRAITSDFLDGDYVLNVWASWCITCIIEHPYLMNLSKNGVPVIGLNYKDEKQDAIIWLNKYGNPFDTILHDFKGNLALDLGVTGAPETFLINDGKVVAHYQGEVNDQIWNDVFLPIIKDRKMF